MEGEGSVKDDVSDCDVDDFGSLDSEEINPSRLLDDLRGVYREHLIQIGNVDEERDESYRSQLQSLQLYVSDLSSKNDMLLETVEELEREANERVALVEAKLENMLSSLQNEKDVCEYMQHESDQVRRQNDDLEYDIEILVNLIGKAMAGGKLEFGNIGLRIVPVDRLFGSHAKISREIHDGEARLNKHISELKNELASRDVIITKLEKTIADKQEEYQKYLFDHSIQEGKIDSLKGDAKSFDLHTEECSGSQTSKEVTIKKLRDDLELSEKQRKALLSNLQESEGFIARLQGEMGRLENDNYISNSDATSKTLAIKTWESNYKKSTLEVARLQEKLKEMERKLKNKEQETEMMTTQVGENASAKIRALELKLKESEDERKDIDDNLVKVQRDLSRTHCELKEEQATLKEELRDYEETVRRLEMELESVKEKYSVSLAEAHEKEKALRKIQQKQMQATYEIEQEKAYLDKIKDDFEAECEMRENAERKFQEIQEKIPLLMSTAEKEKEAMIDKIDQQTNSLAMLEQKLNEMKIANLQYSDKLTESADTIRELHFQLNTIKNEKDNQMNEVKMLKESLENEVKMERERRSRTEGKYHTAQTEAQRLQVVSEDLKASLLHKVEMRNKSIVQLEGVVGDLRMKNIQQCNKVQECEDTVQQLNYKLKLLENETGGKVVELEREKTVLEEENKAETEQKQKVMEQLRKVEEEIKKIRSEADGQRDVLANEVAERHGTIVKLKGDIASLEERHRDAVTKLAERDGLLKQMKDECVEYNMKIEEYKTKSQKLALDYEESKKKLTEYENRLQFQEKSSDEISETYAKQIAEKEASFRQSQDTGAVLKEQLAQTQLKVNYREEALKRIQQQQKDCLEEVSRREKAIQKLELELLKAQECARLAQDDIMKKDESLRLLEAELEAVNEKQRDAIEQNGRLETRCQSQRMSAQSEHDTLTDEICHRDETIHKLQIEKLHLEEQIAMSEDEIKVREQAIENTKEKYEECIKELEDRNRSISYLEDEVNKVKQDATRSHKKLDEYEDLIKELTFKMNSVENDTKNSHHQVSIKEEIISQLTSEIEALTTQGKEVDEKFRRREQMIEQLEKDLKALNTQQKEKEKQIVRHADNVKKLEWDLKHSHSEFSELHRKSSHETVLRDDAIKTLQQARDEYHNKLVEKEEMIESLNHDNDELRSDIQEKVDQLVEKDDVIEQLELDLTISQEKHRTCSEEVLKKDESIMALQMKIDAMQEECKTCGEELKGKAEVIVKLNTELSSLKDQFSNLIKENETLGANIAKSDADISQLTNEKQNSEQQLVTYSKSIEKLQTDLSSAEESHTTEKSEHSEKFTKLKSEFTEGGKKLRAVKVQLKERENQLEALTKEMDHLHGLHKQSLNTLSVADETTRKQEQELEETSKQGDAIKERLQETETQYKTLTISLAYYKEQSTQGMKQVEEAEARAEKTELKYRKQEETVKCLNEKLRQKSEAVNQLTERYENECSKGKQQGRAVEECVTELSSTREALERCKSQLSHCDEMIQTLKEKLVSKQKEIVLKDESIENITNDLELTKVKFVKAEREINGKNGKINELKVELLAEKEQHAQRVEQATNYEVKLQKSESELKTLKDENRQFERKFSHENETSRKAVSELEERKQRHIDEVSQYEKAVQQLSDELGSLRDNNEIYENEITRLKDNTRLLQECLTQMENNLKDRNDKVADHAESVSDLRAQLALVSGDYENLQNEKTVLGTKVGQLSKNLQDYRLQHKTSSQEFARSGERLVMMEQKYSVLEQQLSQKVAEVVRLDKLNRKLQLELNNELHEKQINHEKITETEVFMEQIKVDLQLSQRRHQDTAVALKQLEAITRQREEELQTARSEIGSLMKKIEAHMDEGRHLAEKLEETNKALQQANKQVRCCQTVMEEKEQKISSLIQKHEEEKLEIRNKEKTVNALKKELGSVLEKNRTLIEEIAIKDGDVRVLRAELLSAQNKIKENAIEIAHYEEKLLQMQKELAHATKQNRHCHSQLVNLEQNMQNVKIHLTKSEGNRKEINEQLGKRSKELANTKAEMSVVKQQNTGLQQQIAGLEDRTRRLKTELKRTQERNKTVTDEATKLNRTAEMMKSELSTLQTKHRQQTEEMQETQEKVVMLKVELATLQEKCRFALEESEKYRLELENFGRRHQNCDEDLHSLRVALDETRGNRDRLQKESELVVQNINNWVKEQKEGNSKLAVKLREQSENIVSLQADKEQLIETNNSLKRSNSSCMGEMEEMRLESEHYKGLQSRAAEQEVVIQQLRARLQENVLNQNKEALNRSQTIEDLHGQLQLNVEANHQLNQRINSFGKESLRQRGIIDQERVIRENLILQLNARSQTILDLKCQIENIKDDLPLNLDSSTLMSDSFGINDSAYISALERGLSKNGSTEKIRHALRRELNKAGVKDPMTLDKSFWIQRVGELSTQLQQSSEYWAEKVRELSAQLERERPVSPLR